MRILSSLFVYLASASKLKEIKEKVSLDYCKVILKINKFLTLRQVKESLVGSPLRLVHGHGSFIFITCPAEVRTNFYIMNTFENIYYFNIIIEE